MLFRGFFGDLTGPVALYSLLFIIKGVIRTLGRPVEFRPDQVPWQAFGVNMPSIILAVLLLFLVPASAPAQHDHEHEPAEIPGLEISPRVLDFEKVFVGEEPVKNVVLINTGKEPLTLKRIYSGCGCAVPRVIFSDGKEVEISKQGGQRSLGRIEPGQKASLEVRFITHGYSGKISKFISVETDHAEVQQFKIAVRAEIVDAIRLEPEVLDFGEVVRGRSVERELLLISEGIGPFDLTGIEPLPAFMRYSVDKAQSPDGDGKPAFALRMKLGLEGDIPLGEKTMILLASIAHDRVKSLRITVKMNVQPKVVFKTGGKPLTGNLDFGVFPRKEGKALTVEIVNLVPAIPYNILDIDVDETIEKAAAVELRTVEDGVRYFLDIRFRPGLAAGYKRGAVSILSDHPDVMLKKIRLLAYAFGQP